MTSTDVLVRIHFFHIKKAAIQAIRHAPTLPEEFANISLFTDLSATALQNRSKLAPITQLLQKNKVPYKWGYPLKLLVSWQGKTWAITSPEMGLLFCKEWKLLPEIVTLPETTRSEHMEPE